VITSANDVAASGAFAPFLSMHSVKPQIPGHAPAPEHEQKRAALSYLNEAWAEARLDGIEDDCMAQACLFAAFADMVSTYGEEATAQYAERLAARVRNGDFSVDLSRQ
jgi:hypothetical protein